MDPFTEVRILEGQPGSASPGGGQGPVGPRGDVVKWTRIMSTDVWVPLYDGRGQAIALVCIDFVLAVEALRHSGEERGPASVDG